MKAILRTLRNQPCRIHEINENEKNTFQSFQHLQRFHPAIQKFNIPDHVTTHKHLELPSKYYIDTWFSKIEEKSKIWNTVRTTNQGEKEECKTFVKIVHLLDPMELIKENYKCPEHPFLPQYNESWRDILLKIHNYNNQAYVDNVANFVLSRFRELNLTPHCILYYGSSTGISQSYPFNISSEFDTYRQCRWFWDGIKSFPATLNVSKPDNDVDTIPNFDEIYKDIITCPFDNLDKEDTFEIELDPIVENVSFDNSDLESIHSISFDDIKDNSSSTSNLDSDSTSTSDSD